MPYATPGKGRTATEDFLMTVAGMETDLIEIEYKDGTNAAEAETSSWNRQNGRRK